MIQGCVRQRHRAAMVLVDVAEDTGVAEGVPRHCQQGRVGARVPAAAPAAQQLHECRVPAETLNTDEKDQADASAQVPGSINSANKTPPPGQCCCHAAAAAAQLTRSLLSCSCNTRQSMLSLLLCSNTHLLPHLTCTEGTGAHLQAEAPPGGEGEVLAAGEGAAAPCWLPDAPLRR
jgi:hypothetical protein